MRKMSTKDRLIEIFLADVQKDCCYCITPCTIVKHCCWCPLNYCEERLQGIGSSNKVCFSHIWRNYTKDSLLKAIKKLERLPKRYFTRSGFNRKAFDEIARELVIEI